MLETGKEKLPERCKQKVKRKQNRDEMDDV